MGDPAQNPQILRQQQCTNPLCLTGTWSWGNQLLWGYDESMDPELQELFDLMVKSGVNLFDTAVSDSPANLSLTFRTAVHVCVSTLSPVHALPHIPQWSEILVMYECSGVMKWLLSVCSVEYTK